MTDDIVIQDLVDIEVEITHPFIGDLVVKLVGPDGTSAVLHNRTGGAIDDLRRASPRGTLPD